MENNRIFNQKNLLKNAIRDVKLEKNDLLKRRKILNKWIRMHKDGTLKKQKEESLKDGFLLQIFGDVLKYVKITDSKEWNLAMELKTKIDGQKADGVLGFFNNKKESVRVVIELKGPYVDLEARQRRQGENRTPIEQAFGYVPKYDGKCEWVFQIFMKLDFILLEICQNMKFLIWICYKKQKIFKNLYIYYQRQH